MFDKELENIENALFELTMELPDMKDEEEFETVLNHIVKVGHKVMKEVRAIRSQQPRDADNPKTTMFCKCGQVAKCHFFMTGDWLCYDCAIGRLKKGEQP